MIQESLTFIEKPTDCHIPVYKVALVRESSLSQLQRPQIRSAAHAAEIFSAYLAGADREHLVTMLLNSKNRIIGINAEGGRWFSFQEDGVLSTFPPWQSSR